MVGDRGLPDEGEESPTDDVAPGAATDDGPGGEGECFGSPELRDSGSGSGDGNSRGEPSSVPQVRPEDSRRRDGEDSVSNSGGETVEEEQLGMPEIGSAFGVVAQAVEKYPEMSWLTGDVEGTPAAPDGLRGDQESGTLGERLFPELDKKDVAEFDRTAVGLLALHWVVENDYDSFTECQPLEIRLSRESFDELREYTLQADIEALETAIVINDLGKVASVVESIADQTGVRNVDHDKILAAGLASDASLSPSFDRLNAERQTQILNGLRTEFNVAQFVRGENVPASLTKLEGLDEQSLRLYLLHSIYDVAGAAGQAVQNGSVVMTESTYRNFRTAIDCLEQLNAERSVEEVYSDHLIRRGNALGLDATVPSGRALTRICCMMRISDEATAERVAETFNQLSENTQAILEKELNTNGTDDGLATLVYYSPDILNNLQKKLVSGDGRSFHEALEIGLTTLARVFHEARILNKNKAENGVHTVMASGLARAATDNPDRLANSDIKLEPVGADSKAELVDVPIIHADRFPRIDDLSRIPGEKVAIVGIGGGSDCVQAAALEKLLQQSGKNTAGVISIRNETTRSQSPSGRIGEKRTVTNHGGEIAEGAYRITAETTGSGRFLENVTAADTPTYLIIEKDGIDLSEQINSVLQHMDGVDTVISVDTGGDALHTASASDQTPATPDQDLRSLQALNRLPDNINKISAEIAVGIDSPPDAETKLLTSNAAYYEPSQSDTDLLIDSYRTWRMDGSDPARFGKTALAWQQALKGDHGIQDIGLPTNLVLDRRNPWNPYIHVQLAMKGIFLMPLQRHLASITEPNQ